VVPEPALVVDRGGVRPDGVERDGVRSPATRATAALDEAALDEAALDEAALDRVWEIADAREVTPVGRGAPRHGAWGAIRSRAGRRSASCCEPIGEPCGR
jgi:hypothetical protein